MARLRGLLWGMVLSIAIVSGCEGDEETPKCTVGEVRDCVCPNRVVSVRKCKVDGTFGGCECSVATAGTGAAGTSTAGTIAGTGTSGTTAGTGTAGTGTTDASVPDASNDAMTMGDGAMDQDSSTPPPAYADCTSTPCAGGETCNATGKFCEASCTTPTECPDPVDGNATKTCTLGKCSLSCMTVPTATMCPTGMGCTDGFPFPTTCAW